MCSLRDPLFFTLYSHTAKVKIRVDQESEPRTIAKVKRASIRYEP